jgi:hypothetical protein
MFLGRFSNNVDPFLRNLVLSGPLFSANVVRKWAMLLGQAIYVLGPLHLKDIFTPIWAGPSIADEVTTAWALAVAIFACLIPG